MLGVITEVTLSVEEIYLLREVLTRHTLDECLGQFDGIMRGGDHVKMWVELFSETCGVFAANRTSETRPRDNPNWTAKNIEVLQQVDNKATMCSPSTWMQRSNFIYQHCLRF